MKEDRDALKLLKQSDGLLKQMEELKENIEKNQEPTEVSLMLRIKEDVAYMSIRQQTNRTNNQEVNL